VFCVKCGNQVPDDAKFCDRCGEPTAAQPIETNQGSQPRQAPQQQSQPTVSSQQTAPSQAHGSSPAGRVQTFGNSVGGQNTTQKPVFVSYSESIKQILKALFLPMSPRGRGPLGYLLYPFLAALKIMVLVFLLPVGLIATLSDPSTFYLTLIPVFWVLPVIFAIMAFKGKVAQTRLKPAELKKQLVALMEGKGATALDEDDADILEFAFAEEKNPIFICAEVSVVDGVEGSYVRLFLSGYTEGIKDINESPVFGPVNDEYGIISLLQLFFGLFVTHGAMKANKIIGQLAQEVAALVPQKQHQKPSTATSEKAQQQPADDTLPREGNKTLPDESGKPVGEAPYPFTPDVRDAAGGYFVYDSDGFAYYLLDSHKRMKAVLLADKNGKPVEPFIDFSDDMLDMRDDGTMFTKVTKVDLNFRYYPVYYDRGVVRSALENLTGSLDQKIAGFNAICDFYVHFPEAKLDPQGDATLYDLIAEGCEICERTIGSDNSGIKRQSQEHGNRILQLARELPNDAKVSALAERVSRVLPSA